MNGAIIGYGIVGQAVAHAFGIKDYFDKKESTLSLSKIAEKRYVFICLPTPIRAGAFFTDDIHDLIRQIASYGYGNIFIIKSTVYVGFADHVMDSLQLDNVVSCPEFLSEDTWKIDSEHPDKVIIGARTSNYLEDLEGVMKSRYKGVDIIKTDNKSAEACKLAINSFYATKVVYVNQVYDFCQKHGVNYEAIREAMSVDKYISKNHLEVFHKGGRGAGGKCLRKDVEAFANQTNSPLIKQVSKLNQEYLGGTK